MIMTGERNSENPKACKTIFQIVRKNNLKNCLTSEEPVRISAVGQ
ncbi:Uncharacterized protein dnm_038500 [Desulfonema magnum]|uniref:Uncharacterized protein n=1 Tax=Desulfonema magnum TaxID=45655 RepID=A0A975BMC4_9BACT|nr:Uncharacterized protein dnm_038500 [Desulfonema magnum]